MLVDIQDFGSGLDQPKPKDTGMGLAIRRSIAEADGGQRLAPASLLRCLFVHATGLGRLAAGRVAIVF